MTELPNWNRYMVVQRDSILGCIPAGFEWMLRTADIQGIDLDNFQNDFNLKAKGLGENNFDSIARAVATRYPNIRIRQQSFLHGKEKLDFVSSLVNHAIPCLLSLTLSPKGGWHIMPVIYIDDQIIRMIWVVKPNGEEIISLEITDIIFRHDYWPGGNDVAWLEM